jgi:hypothetical protein
MQRPPILCAAFIALSANVHAAESDAATNLAAKEELPEGKGIAAAFVADADLRKHPT